VKEGDMDDINRRGQSKMWGGHDGEEVKVVTLFKWGERGG